MNRKDKPRNKIKHQLEKKPSNTWINHISTDKISNDYLPVSRTSGSNKLYSIPTTRSPAMSPLCRRPTDAACLQNLILETKSRNLEEKTRENETEDLHRLGGKLQTGFIFLIEKFVQPSSESFPIWPRNIQNTYCF